MDLTSIGAGLVALAFWGFLAAVVVGGIWYAAREKESQQETLRRIIESGRDLDDETLARVLGENDEDMERDLKIASYITMGVAPGMLILAVFLGQINEKAFFALLGVSGLVAFVAGGLWYASKYVASQKNS